MLRSTNTLGRVWVVWTGYLVVAGWLVVACRPGSATAEQSRPNILFIAVDDLRPELGCYGQKQIKTPHIDRLASQGVTFTRAYCQQAVCNPSRASLMTGLRPDTLQVWDLRTDFRQTLPTAVTLPQHLKRHGYHTVAIGKIFHNNLPDPISWSETKLHIDGYPFDPDAVYVNRENLDWLANRKETIIAAGNQARYIDRYGLWYLKAAATEVGLCDDSDYFDGAQTDVAIAKLKELKDRQQPFFFGVGYYRPHLPFNAPKKYWDQYDPQQIDLAPNPQRPRHAPLMATNTMRELRGSYNDHRDAPRPDQGSLTEAQARHLKHGYYASVSYVDTQIGRLLDALDQLALRDNTIIVLWGDHGWKLGEHNSWCKMTNYEIDTRVPLIVSKPAAAENGQACERLVEFVDVFPTLCELTGAALPPALEGLSFAPLLQDRRQPWKQTAFSQFLREGIWTAPDGIEYMGYSMRTADFRFVQWQNWSTREVVAEELYDLKTDPLETVNQAGTANYQTALNTMRTRWQAGWKAARPE